jgi:hypothetical protein
VSGLSVQLTFGKLGETLMLGNSPTQFRWIFCGKNACLTLVLSGAFPCHMQAFEVETRNRKLANIRPSLRILHIWLSASRAIALGQVQETREFDLLRREFQAEVQTLSNRPVTGERWPVAPQNLTDAVKSGGASFVHVVFAQVQLLCTQSPNTEVAKRCHLHPFTRNPG